MTGKTLVISGATKGIGRATAYKFAEQGVNIAFTYNSNEEIANDMVKDLEKSYGIKARCYSFNILEPEKYKELFLKKFAKGPARRMAILCRGVLLL